MARKALIVVLVYETSITNLFPVKKVVNSIFKQRQNNYCFNNVLFKLIVCSDPKVRQLVIIIIKIIKVKFQKSLRGGPSYKNQTTGKFSPNVHRSTCRPQTVAEFCWTGEVKVIEYFDSNLYLITNKLEPHFYLA